MRLYFSFRLLYTFNLLFPFVNSSQVKTHNKPASLAARMLTLDSSCTSQVRALEIFKLKASDTNKQVQCRMILVRGRANSLFSYLFIYFCCTSSSLHYVRFLFSDQRLNPGSLLWECRVLATGPPGKSPNIHFLRESSTRAPGSTSGLQCCGYAEVSVLRGGVYPGAACDVRHCSWFCSLQGFSSFPENLGLPLWLRRETVCLQCGRLGSIPGSGRSPGEGNGNTLQYSCPENPMNGGAWWAIVHGVAKS